MDSIKQKLHEVEGFPSTVSQCKMELSAKDSNLSKVTQGRSAFLAKLHKI